MATGYQLGSRGLKAVTDREVVPAGACAVYATTSDMAPTPQPCAAAAQASKAGCWSPKPSPPYAGRTTSPIPAYPAWAWGSSAARWASTRPLVTTGSGQASTPPCCSPRARTPVVAFANTGPVSPLAAPGLVAHAVLRSLLDLPDDAAPTSVPEQPWAWSDPCGWYSVGPGVLTDPQPRMLGVIEVAIHHGHLVIRGPIPVPAIRRELRLYPDGGDPYAFRVELPWCGSGTFQVVFSRGPAGEVTAMHLGYQPLSFGKRPVHHPRPSAAGALAAGALAVAMARRRPRHQRPGPD